MSNTRVGIDIGGTGIKGALVDVDSGSLIGERVRVPTPAPATPVDVARSVGEVAGRLDYTGPVGVGFPAVVIDGSVCTANNIDRSWIGVNARDLLTEALGLPVAVVNDADAAAVAEGSFGVARGCPGTVVVLTFGTGIGSGVLVQGELVPNIELGQLELEGHVPAETFFSARARETGGIGWDDWGDRANRFITHVHALMAPALIAVGGGAAKKWDRWAGRLDDRLPVSRAALSNNAGIVGAASLVA